MKRPRSKAVENRTRNSRRFPLPWRRKEQGGRIYLRWRILLGYLVLLTVVLWLGTGTGLYFFIKYRSGYMDVSYWQVTGLPFTLKKHRVDRGHYWIAQGKQAAAAGLWLDAFGMLRGGLTDVPDDQEARLLLARIFVMAGRPDQVRQVLVEGLAYNLNELEYLRTVIGFLFSQQADDSVIELAETLREQANLSQHSKKMIAIAQMYAYFNRGRFEEATKAMKRDNLSQSPEGLFIKARISWETGDRPTAITLLKDLNGQIPRDAEIYRALMTYLRDARRVEEARRTALSRQFAFSSDPDAYIDYITLCSELGETFKQEDAEKDFIQRFKNEPTSLVKLIAFAAKSGRTELCWELANRIDSKNEKSKAIFLSLEAEFVRKAYEIAYNKTKSYMTEAQSWTRPQRISLSGFQAIALLGEGNKSDSAPLLKMVLEAPAIPLSTLLALATHAQTLGESEVAQSLLQRAVYLDPLSQSALVALLRLALEQKDLDNSISLAGRLPSMRKPPLDLMTKLLDGLESDNYLFVVSRRPVIDSLRNKIQAINFTGLPDN